MSRPLLITDCDEVLLHMVRHFRDWLADERDILFAIEHENWGEALIRRETGAQVPVAEVWPFVDDFFDTEMDRQTPVKGVIEALDRITAHADIVVLTNLPDHRRQPRIDQLSRHGIGHEVYCNQGGKGEALNAILDAHRPPVAVFVDDLSYQLHSVAKAAPQVWRLHMVAEPLVAVHRPPAPDAHARIDDWARAADWILARFAEGPAPALTDAVHEA
jgi:FMN phosphatase YigB (HAD superfamily)